jgi:peptidoglycan/xylan/chitin deacetylase (PgdA/CDA1 family)
MKAVTFLFILFSLTAQAQEKVLWPDHKQAVIILTYDDALMSQLNTAIPQLEAAHLTATFFLTGDMDSRNIDMWRAVSKKGYELGNHTIFHPCVGFNDNPVSSDGYTVYRMIREIEVMNHFLFAVDGKTTRTFSYPCTDTTAGGKSYVDSLKYYGLVKYARLGGDTNTVITDFKHLDPLRVPSYGLEGNNTGAQLIAYVKRVQQSGGMGVFMFHGIGGDYITTPAEAHQELLNYLKENGKTIWVTTFQEGMDYVSKAKAANNYIK